MFLMKCVTFHGAIHMQKKLITEECTGEEVVEGRAVIVLGLWTVEKLQGSSDIAYLEKKETFRTYNHFSLL